MNIIKVHTHEELSIRASMILASQILKNKHAILGLATGSTPISTYQRLIQMHQEGILDFSNVVSYNLDEYIGLEKTNPQSYHYFMTEHLFKHINIKKENTHIPDGTSQNIKEECASYEEELKQAGGVDLQLLGIGINGHIGFNEPGDEFIYATHETALTESTLKANARFFSQKEEMPKSAITMGIGTIMSAKSILLLGSQEKEKIIHDALNGPITPKVPASILQVHKDVTVIYTTP